MVGQVVKGVDDDGNTVEYPRTIFTNINRLLLDHELIDGKDVAGLGNWQHWAKPGSYIVFDEVQKVWPPRPNGAKVPDAVESLQTHRHMGVDFVLLTQEPLLIDRAVRALVDRHIHVRRLWNSPFAMLYEWDRCSNALGFSHAMAKRTFRFRRAAYRLYKSAEVHTKQKRAVPPVLWFVLLASVAFAVLLPTVYGRISDRTGLGKPQAAAAAPATAPAKPSSGALGGAPSLFGASPAGQVKGGAGELPQSAVAFAGCALRKDVCWCYDEGGKRQDVRPEFCVGGKAMDLTGYFDDLPKYYRPPGEGDATPGASVAPSGAPAAAAAVASLSTAAAPSR